MVAWATALLAMRPSIARAHIIALHLCAEGVARMRRGLPGLFTRMMPALVVLAMVSQSSNAQAQAYKPPRTVDGRPDLQGIWQVLNTASFDLEDHGATLGVPAGLSVVEGGDIPYKPEALAKRKQN